MKRLLHKKQLIYKNHIDYQKQVLLILVFPLLIFFQIQKLLEILFFLLLHPKLFQHFLKFLQKLE